MQSSKALLIGAFAILAAGASWYVLSSPNIPQVAQTQAPAPTQVITQKVTPADQPAPEPTKTSSNDQIIDYIVDGVTKAETASAKQTIDSQAPASQVDKAASLNTNF